MTFWRSDIVGRIAGPRAFSQRVFLPVLVFLSVGGAASESRATPDEIVGWNTVTFIALVGSWLLATISGAVVDRVFRRSGTPRFVAVIVVYFVVEASRAVLMAWLAFDRNLDPDPNWAYRIVAGGLTGLALFGVVAFVLAETDDYRATLGDLIVSARQMEELVSATEADLEVRRVQLLEAVRSAVTEAIRGVLTAGGSSARIVANELVRVSEEIVRPLSHSLIPAVALPSSSSERPSITKPGRINAREVLRYATYVEPFRPEAVATISVLLSLGAVVFIFPLDGQLGVLASLLWVYGYLWLMRRYVQPRLERVSLPWRVVVLVACFTGVAIVPEFALTYTAALQGIERTVLFIYIVVVTQTLMWLLAIIAGMRSARADVIAELREANERLLWQRTRLSQYLWGHQNVVAVALHKDVQGTLMAAAMKLTLSRDAGKNDDDAIDDIRATVLEAAEFVTTPLEAPPLRTSIAELNQRWAGVFEVLFDFDDATSEIVARVDDDDLARRITTDLLAEFVTNAIKHGSATHARVTLSNVSHDVVRLGATNNGRPMPEHPELGLGARMMIAVTVDRGYENVDGGVRMWADIPVVSLV